VRSGASGPLAGIVHSMVLVIILMLAAPFAERIPLCSLAAILFVVAWNMSEWRHCLRMVRRAPRADVAILMVTFVLTVFTDLVIAVNIGVLLATLHFLRRMSDSVAVTAHDDAKLQSETGILLPRDVVVFGIDGPFFFGATETLERTLAATHADPRWLILRLGRVPFVDITGLHALEEALAGLKRRRVGVLICEANSRVLRTMKDAGLVESLGVGGYHVDFASALAHCVGGKGELSSDLPAVRLQTG